MTEEHLFEDRVARLRAEMKGEGVDIPDDLAKLIAEELVHARFIRVHEGIRPPYGALVTVGYTPDASSVREVDGPPEQVRPFADGTSSFVWRDTTAPQKAGLLLTGAQDELSALRLAEESKGVLVQRHLDGTISITQAKEVWVNEGFTWRHRPAARDRLLNLTDVLQLPTESYPLFVDLLDFAFHQLSPRHIGATLVVSLKADRDLLTLPLGHLGYALPVELSVRNEEDRELMIGFLRVVDGACLVAADGGLVRTQVKLSSLKETSGRIGSDRGMRHSSAKWFSFENPEVVVIVVSADGPVTIYSDGAKVAVLESQSMDGLPNLVNTVSHQASRITDTWETHRCSQCGRDLDVLVKSLEGADSESKANCPICGNALTIRASAGTWVRPRKPWWE